jgi:DNA topoisomerase-1
MEGHDDDEEEQEGMLPAMKVSENFTTIILRQRSDIQDLRHAIEASLKKLEELGIGRPSTYTTISTILNRNYVEKGNLTVRENIHN